MLNRVFKRFPMKIAKILVAILDVALVLMSYLLAVYIRFGGHIKEENWSAMSENLPYLLLGYIALYYALGLYNILRRDFSEQMLSIVISNTIMLIASMAIVFFQRDFAFPRSIFLIAYVFQIILSCIFRFVVLFLRRRQHGELKVMVIGKPDEVDGVVRQIVLGQKWYELKTLIRTNNIECDRAFYRNLMEIDVVYLGPNVSSSILETVTGADCLVYKIPSVLDVHVNRSAFQQCGDVPVYMIPSLKVSEETLFFKRVFDLVIALPALIILAPFFALVAVAIKVDSRGPVFYKQERLTYKGKPFEVYKFRSMKSDAEAETGPVLAVADDMRITSVGKFIRKTRIDELPQLINVLIGDMSIVGPRPERAYFVNEIVKTLPEFIYRMEVKAGITGLAQVNGRYTTTNQDKLIYDLMYIRACSVLADIKIILNTFKVVLSSDAAQGVDEKEPLEMFLLNQGMTTTRESSYWCVNKNSG